MRIRRIIESLLAIALSFPLVAASASGEDLPKLGADAKRVSISGLSSGAFMAVQYDVAFSASTIGVGVVAGGPYNCSYVNMVGITTCMQGSPSGAASYNAAIGFQTLGKIDPIAHIAKQKVYLFSGTSDSVVKQSVMDAVRDFYQMLKVPAASLIYMNTTDAGHAFISQDFGNGCNTNQAPYVNECSVGGALYDQPAAILGHIYGTLKPKANALSAQPVAFDQTTYAGPTSSMAAAGYLYVPAACRGAGAKCAVHVVFHGCLQSAESVGDAVYAKLGYNEWADTNGIIVLYPQVNKNVVPVNPNGCWDWWGYSGLDFQTQSGTQIAAIHAMVKTLTSQ